MPLAFAGALRWYLDGTAGREVANDKALKFVTGYLIDKSLAVDNVFVWLMLFSFFAIPLELQKRVLALGVVGAIVMRSPIHRSACDLRAPASITRRASQSGLAHWSD